MKTEENKKLEDTANKYAEDNYIKFMKNPEFNIKFLIKNAYKAGYKRAIKSK